MGRFHKTKEEKSRSAREKERRKVHYAESKLKLTFRDRLCTLISLRSVAIEHEDEAMSIWLTARNGVIIILEIVCLSVIVEMWLGPDFYFTNTAVDASFTRGMFFVNNKTDLRDEEDLGLLLPDFTGISTREMVWDWLNTWIVPMVASPLDAQSSSSSPPPPVILMTNAILGKVRIRQVRVKSNTCAIQKVFAELFAECFGAYSEENEMTEPFGPNDSPEWQYRNAADLGGDSFTGLVATYGAGGYVVDLPQHFGRAAALLKGLADKRWLDEATRMLFVDINMYNADSNVFVLARLLIEIPPTAGLLPYSQVDSLKLFLDDCVEQYIAIACYIVFLVCALWTLLEQTVELLFWGPWSYFSTMAHYFHVVFVVMGLVVGTVGLLRMFSAPPKALEAYSSSEFVDLGKTRFAYEAIKFTMVLLLFVSWIRLMFLSDFGQHSKLSSTLYRSLPDLLSFSFMFGILLSSFSMLAYLVFGSSLYEYRTWSSAVFELLHIVIGKPNYKGLTETNRILGPIFYVSFIFFVVLVLYNMFIVILNDTYHSVRENAPKVDRYQVMPLLKHSANNVLKRLRLPPSVRLSLKPLGDQDQAPRERRITLRQLRSLFHACKLPRKDIAAFIWQWRQIGIEEVRVENAAEEVSKVTEGRYKQPASWEHFMQLWKRLREVEKCAQILNEALNTMSEHLH